MRARCNSAHQYCLLIALLALPACLIGEGSSPSGSDATYPAADAPPIDSTSALAGIVSGDRLTQWHPGIPGGIPNRTTICATVGAPYNDGVSDAAAQIQSALDNCPVDQVVALDAGTYRVSNYLEIRKGVTLRGVDSRTTKIVAALDLEVAAIYMRNGNPWYINPAVDVTADLPKDTTVVPVADGSRFAVGDIVQIDQFDDTSYLFDGEDPYFKRPDYGPPTSAHRSLGQTTMITAVNGNNLTIADPIHLGFSHNMSPQVFKPDGPPPPDGSTDPPGITKYAGLENLYVTGGRNDQINISNCAFCWVAGVESDGTTPADATAPNGTAGPGNGMVGAHLLLDRSYRAVVRDSYFHHASRVVQGGGAYGISLARHTSDSLIENNIVYYMNKPLTMRGSGGGNVVGYNYIDDAWTSADGRLQETTLDMGHTSFPYMELVEGNYVPQIATENVWGNSGWMTVFRNVATSQQRRTAANETYQIAAIAFEAQTRNMNVIGNVLGAPGVGLVYEVNSNPPGANQAAVFRLGHGRGAGGGADDIDGYEDPTQASTTASQLIRHGNFDFVNNATQWDPGITMRTLPNSLYLCEKPAFFGPNQWPWVDPIGPMPAYTLPAKARFDACAGPSGC